MCVENKMNIRTITMEEIKGNSQFALQLLQQKCLYFCDVVCTKQDNMITISSSVDEEYFTWKTLQQSKQILLKLQYLLKLSELFYLLEQHIYTYEFMLDNIMFCVNGDVKLIVRGIYQQIPLYEKIDQDTFLFMLKVIIVVLFDVKADYPSLLADGLFFYKATTFLRNFLEQSTLYDLQVCLKKQIFKQIQVYNKKSWLQKWFRKTT